MLEHVLISAKKLNPSSINVVLSPKIESIKKSFGGYDIDLAYSIRAKRYS